MRVRLSEEDCVGCGICVVLCPRVFKWDPGGKALVAIEEVVDEALERCVRLSIESCPTRAIRPSKD